MIIMSVDLGKARTGIAVCDKTEFLASPYTVIFEKSPKQLLEKVSNTAKETKAELIVVGLPKNMDGSEGESAQNARAFAENLSNETGIECVMQDERGTTITAHNFLNTTNTRGKKRKNVVDEVAATIILQDYLDKRKSGSNNQNQKINPSDDFREGYSMHILKILLIIVIIYAILISCTTDYMAFDASTVSQCVLPIVMAIVNKVYFDRRKDIFVN